MKQWKAGKADDAWKVLVCAKEAEEITRALECLISTLTDAGSDSERGLFLVSRLSGADIVASLKARHENCVQSVRNAIGCGQ